MSTLVLENITKRFGEQMILDKLDLQVNDGEFVSLLGPSGSGKSTIFHLIGGLYQADQGMIRLDNETINGKKGSISYMPQTPSLFPWRTVLENVILNVELYQKPDKQKALEMLERAGLKDYANAYPHELSGGMRQRVAFVRSLLSPQSFICLDEPFSSLDEFTRLEMQKWLLSIWEQERPSVLFVTHNIEEAIFLSDRILVLGSKPANVIKEFSIDFERPRNEKLTLSTAFLETKKEIYQTLRGVLDV
ncbi:ABC-type nitrate/sulfonate/bicarbonate transport system, ATPase component [Gracilibacillus orientalis]|uniref:ABC-type nitrate/sulfonate/bicarbonate transport system, ATPase component n=1 Tax=Gracilibacillus orientalis TaxID=334253 RepID=A0A1I4GXE5_9BACI|nr:ABC transporter ATP-binding protein [Gracilibacillus orientalis]SFL34629.1 ABC-type nitrate/sulfonate/bicarbonate transport system, ATPase component [Gracilibacillus orientalis]